jgi:hypothetical protein
VCTLPILPRRSLFTRDSAVNNGGTNTKASSRVVTISVEIQTSLCAASRPTRARCGSTGIGLARGDTARMRLRDFLTIELDLEMKYTRVHDKRGGMFMDSPVGASREAKRS